MRGSRHDARSRARKIFFIGRKHGLRFWKVGLKLETKRTGEVAAFRRQRKLRRTLIPGRADIIFARNRPESTTDDQLAALNSFIDRYDDGTRLIVNPLRNFQNADSKDRAFSIWNDAEIPCPRHWVIETDLSDPEDLACVDFVLALRDAESRILLRTNNESAYQGLHVIDGETSPDRIRSVVRDLKAHAARLRPIRRDTKLICVKYIDTRDPEGYATLARAFVVLDRVFCYYALVSKRDFFRAGDMVPDVYDRWLAANVQLRSLMQDSAVASRFVQAVASLGNNIGAVDFLVQDGAPVLLEMNPLWGQISFGNNDLVNRITATQDSWSGDLPNIAEFLDYVSFYRRMYESIADYADRNPGAWVPPKAPAGAQS